MILNIRFAVLESILSTLRYTQRTLDFDLHLVLRLCPTSGAFMVPAVPYSLLW
jgi:hypothetical protein